MVRIFLTILCLQWAASLAMHPAPRAGTDSTFALFGIDSTAIRGSDYGSFAEFWNHLPMAYVYDRGSVGQPAYPALGTVDPGYTRVIYDDLHLNDPLTGKADLNLIPTESVSAVWLPFSGSGLRGHTTAPARTVFMQSIDIAAQPVRTRVAYRTGDSGIDDVDVRLGIKISPQMSLNSGALLKNYAGTSSHSKYRTQKVNVKLKRSLWPQWQGGYTLLYNKSDLDLALGLKRSWIPPDPQTRTLTGETLQRPHEKLVRFDHGFFLQGPQEFRSILQITDLHHELYGYRHTVVDQTLESQQIRLSSSINPQWNTTSATAAASVVWTRPDFGVWNVENEWQYSLVLGARKKLDNIRFSLSARLDNSKQSDWQVLPHASISYFLDAHLFHVWLEKDQRLPSLYERYSNGPFALGNLELTVQSSQIAGASWKRSIGNWSGSLSFMVEKVTDPLGIGLQSMVPAYTNGQDETRVCLDWQETLPLLSWLDVVSHWQEYRRWESRDDQPLVKRPERWAQLVLKARHVFFQNDLDITLFIGADYFGPVSVYDPFFNDFQGYDIYTGEETIYPYVHLRFIVGDATLYAAFHNPMSNDLFVWPGFPEPKAELRWGFAWSFVD